MSNKNLFAWILSILFVGFTLVSYFVEYDFGLQTTRNFLDFSREMLKILPCAFILVGFINVWIPRKTVERYFGEESSPLAHLWATFLASTSLGGLHAILPIAASFQQKGARNSVILTYLNASPVFRLPMLVFEASFLGIKFTLSRLIISYPLVLISSLSLGSIFDQSSMTNYDH